MQQYTEFTGVVAPLDRANVDTDQIIPKQFLKSIKRTGFGAHLFDAWRFEDAGVLGMAPESRTTNHQFVLNEARYQGAQILLAGENFACGSSREHAVWALMEYGFRCVIAPSFADIFTGNCFKNGLLPVVLDGAEVSALLRECESNPGFSLIVDLAAMHIGHADGRAWPFRIKAGDRERLLQGLDDIGLSLAHAQDIRAFETRHQARFPWLFEDQPCRNA